MFWTQSHSGTCTHIPFSTCFVALRPTLEGTCRNSRKKKKTTSALFSMCTRGYSPGLNAAFKIWALPPHTHTPPLINCEAVTADLKSCGGKIHLMQHWMAGHTMTKALSESYEAYLITVLQRAMSLSFFLFCRYLCLSHSVSLSLAQSQTAHSRSTLYNLWCCYTC